MGPLRRLAAALLLVICQVVPLAAQPSPPKAFLRDDLQLIGAQIEERLKREVALPANADGARFLREAQAALTRDNPRAALQLAHQAVMALPRDPQAWRMLARVAKALPPRDWRERYEMQERALGAAYFAYQRSRTRAEEGQMLALLADLFEWREMWRPALTAYRLSIEAEDNAEIRKAYEALREQRGFRILRHEVDADSATPRACFVFSEPLARGRVDFAPFIATTGRGDFAITAENEQICVEGLRHGERYAIVLRQGIPSAIPGENLLKNADYEIYVRDRQPSARGSGRAYVLPRIAEAGIPITSVNSNELGVKLVRIGDRNLISTLREGGFLDPVEPFRLKRLTDEIGQPVWTGTMAVRSELNRDVVTNFPINEAIGALKPGVYVLVAKPGAFREAVNDADSDDGDPLATQWFVVSDLGLTVFSGGDGITVLAKSLGEARALADVEVRLIARNNEVLGTQRTDASGRARFEPGLWRGTGGLAPGLVTAELSGDYGFLDLQQSAFDFSDRGVKGRIAPVGLDAYLYAERGVYRSGETAFVTALLRDVRGTVVTGMPLTLIVKRPDGMEYRRALVEDQGQGGRALSVPLLPGVATGTWRVQAFTDPKRPPIGETTFLVEDYVPERLDVKLSASQPALKSGADAEINAEIRYLYGAPGADLSLSGEMIVRVAKESAIPGFAGFRVGLTHEPVEPTRGPIEDAPRSDNDGKATLVTPVKEPETNQPLEAEFIVTASESGGRGVTRTITLPILPKGIVIGVKPVTEPETIQPGGTARFGVILATGDGRRLARSGLKWQLSRINKSYQWFFKEGRWAFEAVTTTRRIADGEMTTSETALAEIATRVDWGQHRLEVRAVGSEMAETSIDFTIGYVAEARADTPDVLDVVLDKPGYADGETMQVRISPRSAGKATLVVMSERIAHWQEVDLPASGITVPVRVSAEWGAGAYLMVLAHRPLDVAQKRLPGRAIGLSWFAIGAEQRKLSIDLGAPPIMRPRSTMTLPVRITNLAPGEEAYITVAAVDKGILALTRHQPPNASQHFFGQRQLSSDVRDLYGALIDGLQGVRGAIRSGGDAAPALAGARPTQEPLARFSGVVKVGPDGTAPVQFELPAFNGSVKLMAVAWTRSRAGETSADVIIRDPIVVQATLPRFLALGDRSRLQIEINPVEAESGTYRLDANLNGPIAAEFDPAWQNLRLEKGRKIDLFLPITAGGLGVAEIELSLNGQGQRLTQTLRIPLKSSAPSVAQRSLRPLQPGQSLIVSPDLLSEMVPGSGSVGLAASPFAMIDAGGLLASLDRYPYGCSEQIVSRALPLLYVNRLASAESLAIDGAVDDRVREAIERVLARQAGSGSFGLWSIGGNDLWLDAFITDFLTRARERNFAVPAVAFTLALDRLRNQVTNVGEVRAEEAAGLAYALYVLARNGRPVMGDLRYLADNQLKAFASPLSKAQIGAALAALGDRGRARTVFAAAEASFQAASADETVFRADYGSKLRDGAGLLALIGENDGDRAIAARLSQNLEELRGQRAYLSTQEKTHLVLAAMAMQRDLENFTLNVDGTERRGAFHRSVSSVRLDQRPITLLNPTSAPIRVMLSVAGIPLLPEPALAKGYAVERQFFTLKGQPIQSDQLRQNDRYVVKITVRDQLSRRGRLMLVDPLPAGLEIENAALGGAASMEGLDFLGDLTTPEHSEARDDRFVVALDYTPSNPVKPLVFAYIVRAVTPGRYTHPAAFVEDMYAPERFGRTAFGSAEILPFTSGGRP